jgi:serine/threonine protein kinase
MGASKVTPTEVTARSVGSRFPMRSGGGVGESGSWSLTWEVRPVAGFEPGRVFAGHRIVRRIARGGMGVVYEAEDERLRRRVALKVITVDDDPRFRQRFVREARLLAEFDHPHVLPVFHAGEEEGLPYLTMRLAEGGSLRGLLGRGSLLPGHALRLLGQLAGALDALHRRGIVHLDVKPENVLLKGPAGDEHVWLADLGLARYVRGGAEPAEGVGTADYMAPEQWRGGEVGPAADVYAFAVVLRETLAGGDRDTLREVFERALAGCPEDRHSSAGAVLDAARAVLGSPPAEAGPACGASIDGGLLLSDPLTLGRPSARTASPKRWRRAVPLVPVLVAVLAWAGWSLRPDGSAPEAAPADSAALTVCAQHLTVRRDPLTQSRTRVLATLAPGDRFTVEAGTGRAWVYGRSSGSVSVRGWALRQWLRPRCP